ncbi:uncharacterized protein C11orf16 homolog [Macrotis lagotis]|uniref:uncharacterized protein C11orf16 homolog n=1 Tax=Macrotis lagotis TaxID=92651 RepID=UPI003D69D8CF
MEPLAGPWMPSHKYCSVTTAQKSPCCVNASVHRNALSTWPLILHVPCFISHPSVARCAWGRPDLHMTDLQRKGLNLQEGPEDGDTSVLARSESDGFYYRTHIKQMPKPGRQGKLLVELEAPHSPDLQQSIAPEDVIQYSWALRHSLLPGDKVLAPWEPEQERYGPGTVVQGLETRDPQRASEDEEITVCFWNGKIAKVPLGIAIWISPVCWEKAVEMLPKSLNTSWLKPREPLSTVPWTPPCSLLGPTFGYTTDGLLLSSFLCPPQHLYPQSHCPLLSAGCLCCCSSSWSPWWPLTKTLEVTPRDHSESELKPTAQLVELDKKVAAHVGGGDTSSSSSSSSSSSASSYSFSSKEETLGSELKKALPQRMMVDSTVNTETSLFEKPVSQKILSQPPWKYWKRSGLEPSQRKPGITAL